MTEAIYNDPEFVFVQHDDGIFRRHYIDYETDYFGGVAECGVESSYDQETGDEFNWYFEHERDDVIDCDKCFGMYQEESRDINP